MELIKSAVKSEKFAAGVMAAGTAVSAVGQLRAGRAAEVETKSAQRVAAYDAAIQEQEAKAIEQKVGFEQKRQAEAAVRAKSRLRARLAATGAVPGPGQELLIEEQAAELELEQLLIGYEGEIAASRARSQAELDRLSGRLAKKRGKEARRTGFLRAGTTLLTGFGTALTQD